MVRSMTFTKTENKCAHFLLHKVVQHSESLLCGHPGCHTTLSRKFPLLQPSSVVCFAQECVELLRAITLVTSRQAEGLQEVLQVQNSCVGVCSVRHFHHLPQLSQSRLHTSALTPPFSHMPSSTRGTLQASPTSLVEELRLSVASQICILKWGQFPPSTNSKAGASVIRL